MKYSFVVPIYNDGELADDFCMAYFQIFKKYLNKTDIEEDTELIFVNDGSINNSLQFLVQAAAKYKFVKIIELSRNFGQHIALSCGYEHASGEFVGMLNVDMEDPPSEIPKLLEHMQQNDLDLVVGTRPQRKSSLFIKLTSFLFNIFLNKLTGNNTPANAATLRIMNRKFINAYNSLNEKTRYIPGLEMWLGFKHGYVNIEHHKRLRGISSYNFKRRLMMAIESILSFSDLPLKLIVIFGIAVAVLGFIMNFILLLVTFFGLKMQHGFTSTISTIIFLGGVQILVIGAASLYIGRILKEVQNRPLYIIRNKYNFNKSI